MLKSKLIFLPFSRGNCSNKVGISKVIIGKLILSSVCITVSVNEAEYDMLD